MRFLAFIISGVYQPRNGKKTNPHFAPKVELVAKMGMSMRSWRTPARCYRWMGCCSR